MLSLPWSERGVVVCLLAGNTWIFSFLYTYSGICICKILSIIIVLATPSRWDTLIHPRTVCIPLSRHKEGVLYMYVKHHESLESSNSRSCEHNTPCCSSTTHLCLYCSYVYWVLAFDFPQNCSWFFICTTCMQQTWNSVKLTHFPTFSTHDASRDHIIDVRMSLVAVIQQLSEQFCTSSPLLVSLAHL